MSIYTYYDILGVSPDATMEEITIAKNTLAKVYHPDSNISSNIDTTTQMQEILEAYKFLSDAIKKKEYDATLGGQGERVYQTFTMADKEELDANSFVIYWQTAQNLYESVTQGHQILKENYQNQNRLGIAVFGHLVRRHHLPLEIKKHMREIQTNISGYIKILSNRNIPVAFWHPDAMNWVMVRWGQKQHVDFILLFHRYQQHVEITLPKNERLRIHYRNHRYQRNLNKLLGLKFKTM
ncbi:MAG: J domain-containing protein [Lachnospiraceae bacterium]|nr:J domain-containing protein [Lachnospiraceae bacterium]